MKRTTLVTVIAISALSVAKAQAARFDALGDLEGEPFYSHAFGVSADGRVVVGNSKPAADIAKGFYWTSGRGMVQFEDLPGGALMSYEAWGVSRDGLTVVGKGSSPRGEEAIQWTVDGVAHALRDLRGGEIFCHAYGVSDDGRVAVGLAHSDRGWEAVRWVEHGPPVRLIPELDAPRSDVAFAANTDDSVIVGTLGYMPGTLPRQAFRWTESAPPQFLDPCDQFTESVGWEVSDDGSMVVGYSRNADALEWEATLWRASNPLAPVCLGRLVNGHRSAALDVARTARGTTIVGHATPGGAGVPEEAAIWREGEERDFPIELLKDYLEREFPQLRVRLADWTLTQARAISPNGRAIVGWGTNPDGNQEAWRVLLDPLELNWESDAGGAWDDQENWDFVLPATDITDVFIQLDVGVTVIGPAAASTVQSLVVDATGSGTATLELQETGMLDVRQQYVDHDDVTHSMIGPRGKITGSGSLHAQGEFTNEGEIDLGDGGLRLSGGSLANRGLIRGSGEIGNTLDNTVDGEVRAESGDRVVFTGGNPDIGEINTNAGEINLFNGIVEFTSELDNLSTGRISGRGQLRVEGGLGSSGEMVFSGGITDIYGDLTNRTDGRIVVCGQGVTTVYDVFQDDGDVEICKDSELVVVGDLKGAGAFLGEGTVRMAGDLQPGNSIGKMSFEGNLVLGSTAELEIELGDEGKEIRHDQVKVIGDGGVFLDGTLTLSPLGKLHGPTGEPPVEWYGDETGTIVEGKVEGTFSRVPDSRPAPGGFGLPGDAPWGQGQLGHGVFLVDDGPNCQAVTYNAESVVVDLFQAADGDTNGDRRLDILDIQRILACNVWPGGAGDWTCGDFTSDGIVDGVDIQAILATGLWGTPQPYAPPPCPGKGEGVELIVDPDTGELSIETGGVPLGSYVIESPSGLFTGGAAENLGWFREDADRRISGGMGFVLMGRRELGAVVGHQWLDGPTDWRQELSMSYTVEGVAGVFYGRVVVPEPGTLVMLAGGLIGLLAVVRRRTSQGTAQRPHGRVAAGGGV